MYFFYYSQLRCNYSGIYRYTKGDGVYVLTRAMVSWDIQDSTGNSMSMDGVDSQGLQTFQWPCPPPGLYTVLSAGGVRARGLNFTSSSSTMYNI